MTRKVKINTMGRVSSLFFILLLLAGGCFATGRLGRARSKFYRGEYRTAADDLNANKPKEGIDAPLLLLERGLIKQAAGDYRESIQDFLQAADLFTRYETYYVTKQATSMLTSDRLLPYRGESFERVLLHTFCTLNYLALGEYEDALVEAKRARRLLDRKDEPDQPLTRYIIGFAYELMGENDDARIEYRQARRGFSSINRLEGAEGGDKERSRILIVASYGRGPVKVPGELRLGRHNRISFPAYRSRPSPVKGVTIIVDGKPAQGIDVSFDLDAIAEECLRQRGKTILIREAARLKVKYELSEKVEEKTSRSLGNLTRLFFFLSERPDTRSWETLPKVITLKDISLLPGTHQVKVHFQGRRTASTEELNLGTITIGPGETRVLLARSRE